MVERIKDISLLPSVIKELLTALCFNDFELSCLVNSIESKQFIIPYWKMMKEIALISSLNIHTNLENTMTKFEKFYKNYESSFFTMAKAYYSKF